MNHIDDLRTFLNNNVSISISKLSVELGRNRNYIRVLLKGGYVSKKQWFAIYPTLIKYGIGK